jgi:hypothetical protein
MNGDHGKYDCGHYTCKCSNANKKWGVCGHHKCLCNGKCLDETITCSGTSNKLATRADFNSYIRGGYFGDTTKVLIASEVPMTFTSGGYTYTVYLDPASDYTNTNRCVCCGHIKRYRTQTS